MKHMKAGTKERTPSGELRKLRKRNAEMEEIIEKLKKTEERQSRSEERYRSLVESTEDSIYLVDRDCRYLFINKRHIKRMGRPARQLIGKPYSEFHSEVETKWFAEKMAQVFETGCSVQHEHWSLRDGRDFLRTFSPVKDPRGKISAVTVVSKDVTRLKRMEEKLHFLSVTDELTRIYNRRGFFTLAEHLLKVAKRMKKKAHMLYVDLDGLKEINDTYGHHEGDMALVELATVLKGSFRESDIVARIGGDEFAVVPVGAEEDTSDAIRGRLKKALDLHNAKTRRSYRLSVSCGVASFDPDRPCSLDDLLVQADKAMYEQKKLKKLNFPKK